MRRLGVIVRNDPGLEQRLRDLRSDAQRQGIEALMLEAPTGTALRLSFARLHAERCEAVYVASGAQNPRSCCPSSHPTIVRGSLIQQGPSSNVNPAPGAAVQDHVEYEADVRHEGSVVRLFDASCRELSTPAPGQQCWSGTKDWRSSALPMAFGAEFFELCPHRRKPPLEDTDDLIADLGGREDGSVYKPTPTINLMLGADDYFTSIAIHADEALGFLNLLHHIFDGHGQVSICSLSDRASRHLNRTYLLWDGFQFGAPAAGISISS
jgi:hypothetical protein